MRSGEHNTHADEEPRVEAAAAAAAAKMGWAASRGAKEEGVETMRPLFGFTLSTNKDCDLMERREREREKERIDEDENKMRILSGVRTEAG